MKKGQWKIDKKELLRQCIKFGISIKGKTIQELFVEVINKYPNWEAEIKN